MRIYLIANINNKIKRTFILSFLFIKNIQILNYLFRLIFKDNTYNKNKNNSIKDILDSLNICPEIKYIDNYEFITFLSLKINKKNKINESNKQDTFNFGLILFVIQTF